jgi:hypothetical protein
MIVKPELRIVHNMARSGGTLISKCLGCMGSVMLLSEIHPLGTGFANPLTQAQNWFNLFEQSDIVNLKKQNKTKFNEIILFLEQRARERGDFLILRDWAHLDYTGSPFMIPDYRNKLLLELTGSFSFIQLSIVRDPVSQWLSLIRLPTMSASLKNGELNLDRYLFGYRKYAEFCSQSNFIRYEDFLSEPKKIMQQACANLKINFDPNFITKWSNYKNITGDTVDGFSLGGNDIRPLIVSPIDSALKKQFLANLDYHIAIKLLGYNQAS